MSELYCQSCAMPMGNNKELYGTNADGSKNGDYCKYCFENGSFHSDCTVEEMIEICVPHMTAPQGDFTEKQARALLLEQLPKLKRWSK